MSRPVNGVSRTTGSLIEHLKRNGVRVAVVAPQCTSVQPAVITAKDPAELRLSGYPLPFNPDLKIAYPFRLDRVYARTFTPDIIYLASPASVGFQFLLQMRQLLNPPIILLNFQTDLAAYSRILFVAPLDRYAQWLLQLVQGFLFKHQAVHTIFYPCMEVRRYLEGAGAPVARMVHLGRGVDTTLFNSCHRDEAYRRELAPNGEIILLSVSRLAPEKGYGFLSQVASRLKAFKIPFKLLIVGGNSNLGVEEEVLECFRTVRQDVIFTGFLKGAALARAYASADLFLHCSITETFGLVVLESFASAVPVIARDKGGPSEIVRHGISGYLVPPNDLECFVARIEELVRCPKLLRQMSEAARDQALATTWERINNKVAWQLADALSEKDLPGGSPLPYHHTVQNQLVNGIIVTGSGWGKFAASFMSAMNFEASIGLIWFFWQIAVLPLLICGFFMY